MENHGESWRIMEKPLPRWQGQQETTEFTRTFLRLTNHRKTEKGRTLLIIIIYPISWCHHLFIIRALSSSIFGVVRSVSRTASSSASSFTY